MPLLSLRPGPGFKYILWKYPDSYLQGDLLIIENQIWLDRGIINTWFLYTLIYINHTISLNLEPFSSPLSFRLLSWLHFDYCCFYAAWLISDTISFAMWETEQAFSSCTLPVMWRVFFVNCHPQPTPYLPVSGEFVNFYFLLGFEGLNQFKTMILWVTW